MQVHQIRQKDRQCQGRHQSHYQNQFSHHSHYQSQGCHQSHYQNQGFHQSHYQSQVSHQSYCQCQGNQLGHSYQDYYCKEEDIHRIHLSNQLDRICRINFLVLIYSYDHQSNYQHYYCLNQKSFYYFRSFYKQEWNLFVMDSCNYYCNQDGGGKCQSQQWDSFGNCCHNLSHIHNFCFYFS